MCEFSDQSVSQSHHTFPLLPQATQSIFFWKSPSNALLWPATNAGRWRWSWVTEHTHMICRIPKTTHQWKCRCFCFSLKYSNNIPGLFSTVATQHNGWNPGAWRNWGFIPGCIRQKYVWQFSVVICPCVCQLLINGQIDWGAPPPPVKRRRGWNRLMDSNPTVSLRAG